MTARTLLLAAWLCCYDDLVDPVCTTECLTPADMRTDCVDCDAKPCPKSRLSDRGGPWLCDSAQE